tara:strand:+ start:228 stop:410 length:183 start_codon:yes stop_codon:yes gene_type:complete
MDNSQLLIFAWATQRVTYLDMLYRYEDNYEVSQEFCDLTISVNVYFKGIKAATIKVPTFN